MPPGFSYQSIITLSSVHLHSPLMLLMHLILPLKLISLIILKKNFQRTIILFPFVASFLVLLPNETKCWPFKFGERIFVARIHVLLYYLGLIQFFPSLFISQVKRS